MQNLKASFRNPPRGGKWIYPKSRAILLISVGQHYHEGEKFEATIRLINKAGFESCTIVIGDTIQRYTLALNKLNEPNDMCELTLQLGNEWLTRNKRFYSKLTIPYNIARWDSWLSHKDYAKYRFMINSLYAQSRDLKFAYKKSARKFLLRYALSGGKQLEKEQKAWDLCLEYLKEECSIIMPLWAAEGYDFVIYPSKMLEAMRTTHEKLIKPYNKDLVRWLHLRFKKIAAIVPPEQGQKQFANFEKVYSEEMI